MSRGIGESGKNINNQTRRVSFAFKEDNLYLRLPDS